MLSAAFFQIRTGYGESRGWVIDGSVIGHEVTLFSGEGGRDGRIELGDCKGSSVFLFSCS